MMTTTEWLKEASFNLETAITNLYNAQEQLGDLEEMSETEWNLSADIESQINKIEKINTSIETLIEESN